MHSRRDFMRAGAAFGALGALSACGNPVGSGGGELIDARVDRTLDYLYATYPSSRNIAERSVGALVMPIVTEAGLGVGGSYGRGALRIEGQTVDYYSATQASLGLQIGAQQYAHTLFFMAPESLQTFRTSPGWAAGADLEYALNDDGASYGVDSQVVQGPVVALVFGQSGLLAGATVEGTKYSRIIP